jgi:hypothetical protein
MVVLRRSGDVGAEAIVGGVDINGRGVDAVDLDHGRRVGRIRRRCTLSDDDAFPAPKVSCPGWLRPSPEIASD